MECADVAAFTFATWQIRWCLLGKFILPEAMAINLFAILRVFCGFRQLIEVNFLAVLIDASWEIFFFAVQDMFSFSRKSC